MTKPVLLVVDVQNAVMTSNPYNGQNVIENIRILIESARENKIEVIYVRHDGGKGDSFEKNTQGWEIADDISPLPTETIFDKRFNSAFRETGLRKYLDDKGITDIILTGMQTEYCIDTTCRVAFEFGYNVIIPENTTTTCDNEFFSGGMLAKYYEQKIWNGRFADIVPLDKIIENIKKGFAEKMEIDFRPICEADFPQLCEWRNSEHVIKWYGKTPVTVDEVAEHHMPYINGEKPTKAYFIVMGGTDIGYIQTYKIYDYPDYNAYVQADSTSAGVDLFIGHTDYVHKGYGMHVMKAFLEKYVFIGDIDKCIIGPEPDNKSAIRMYEKSGFEWYKTIQIPDEDAPEHLMMITKEKFILEKISQTS